MKRLLKKSSVVMYLLVLMIGLLIIPNVIQASTLETKDSTQPVCSSCNNGDKSVPNNSPAKTVKNVSDVDENIISLAQNSLISSSSQSSYTVDDFEWNKGQVSQYNESDYEVVIFPAKLQTNLEKTYLQFTYDSKSNKLGQPIIMKLNRQNPNNDKHFTMTYNTLDNKAIVGIKLDYEKKTAEKIMYNNEDDVIAQGYWDCVQDCLINTWANMPVAWQIVCEGACGGCIWGANAFICGGCLSCLAGYGIGCGTVCI